MTLLPETVRRPSIEFWSGVAFVVALVLIVFGGVFAIGGLSTAPLPQVYEVIVRYVPGGLHSYGVVMVLLGFSLLHGIVPRSHGEHERDLLWARRTLLAIIAFCSGIAAQFGASWALTHVQTWSAITYWMSITAFAGLCLLCPPESKDGRAA